MIRITGLDVERVHVGKQVDLFPGQFDSRHLGETDKIMDRGRDILRTPAYQSLERWSSFPPPRGKNGR